MILIKYMILFTIFGISTSIGIMFSKKSKNRVLELKELKNAINIIENKMKFTYETLEEIFEFVSENTRENISKIFYEASKKIKGNSIKSVWENAIKKCQNNLSINKEDEKILINLGNNLGKTDIDGQISELELALSFIDSQILKAEEERKKNEKMYKSLGGIIGLAIVIILI